MIDQLRYNPAKSPISFKGAMIGSPADNKDPRETYNATVSKVQAIREQVTQDAPSGLGQKLNRQG